VPQAPQQQPSQFLRFLRLRNKVPRSQIAAPGPRHTWPVTCADRDGTRIAWHARVLRSRASIAMAFAVGIGVTVGITSACGGEPSPLEDVSRDGGARLPEAGPDVPAHDVAADGVGPADETGSSDGAGFADRVDSAHREDAAEASMLDRPEIPIDAAGWGCGEAWNGDECSLPFVALSCRLGCPPGCPFVGGSPQGGVFVCCCR